MGHGPGKEQDEMSTIIAAEVAESTAIGFYLVYAAIAIGLVVWLARTLHKNGEVFLRDVFEDGEMAGAVNHLLVVGFYLLNMGYALLLYRLDPNYRGNIEAFNDLIYRVGVLVVSLGAIHLLNMLVFWRIRNHKSRAVVPTPAQTMFMPPPPPAPDAGFARPTPA